VAGLATRLLLLLLLLVPPGLAGLLPGAPGPADPPPLTRVVGGPGPEPGAGYRWPVDGQPPVTRPFDPPARRWLPGHRGVDLAGSPGTVVRAAGPGVVFFAGPVAGRGVVSIDHPDRFRTTYQPVVPTVVAGQRVAVGDPIGVLGAGHPGCPAAACLHWGVRRGETYLDPLALLGLGQVRLLPRAGDLVAGDRAAGGV
jgi:murein DD-endopeptidase MepM/ murein hydrolase activator NlpD